MTIKEILNRFNENYEYIYNSNDNLRGYRAIVAAGELYADKRPDVFKAFTEARQDYLASDREYAAYALTMTDLNLV